jgi:hypothetical protein
MALTAVDRSDDRIGALREMLSLRFDFNLTNNDKFFIRLQEDKGLLATYADPIAKVFYAQSDQPEYQGRASWSHSFGAKAVNSPA